MEGKVRKNVYWLIALVVFIAFSALMAHYLERDFGKVDVDFVRLVDPEGYVIAAKIFRPVDATPENKMPG
ncbi:MAG: hypothetical protein MUP22_03150, partial [Desulfobacterales bacterium]|nr:hypothetical protein [Desulfobacterales bacterium]